jgi:SET domain-containing protein
MHIDASSLVRDTTVFYAVHMNHSRSRANVRRTKSQVDSRVLFHAARDIGADEELMYDYGSKFWLGREDQEMS